jgi:hypothetical protein
LTWAERGVRERATIQRIADNAKAGQLEHWIETGHLQSLDRSRPAEDTPEVHIAKAQIRKDGRIIIENVTRATEEWREQHKTSKLEEPS